MKSIISCGFLFLLLLPGCVKSEQERALSDMVDYMNDMTDILADIEDADSAEQARAKLERLGKKMETATERMANSMTRADPQEMQKLMMKYQKPMDEAGQKFLQEMMRVACIQGVGYEFENMFSFVNTDNTTSSGST